MLSEQFEVAAGSVPGRDHVGREGLLIGRNNHDAFGFLQKETWIAAVVADGCGSKESPHSEVGAKIGVRLLLNSIDDLMLRHKQPINKTFFSALKEVFLAKLAFVAMDLGGSLSQALRDYFYFTLVGTLVTEEMTYVFYLGDGYYAVNGKVHMLGPFKENMPPYAAYNLLQTEFASSDLEFSVLELPTSQVQSMLLASDGLKDVLNNEARCIPGTAEKLGSIAQFWRDDQYFLNSDAIRRRLALVNSEAIYVDPKNGALRRELGLLSDDTTIVVLRRSNSIGCNQ